MSFIAKLPEFLASPLGLSILIGGGTILGFWWLLSVKHSRRDPVLDPDNHKEFPLVEKIPISHNTALYRFGLPDPEDNLGLPAGTHITVTADIDGKTISRSYTPTSGHDDLGHFDLVIKSYEKGNVSKHFQTLKIGDKIKVKGPKGNFKYTPELAKEIGMIAGGSGITPMYQIARHSLFNPGDPTKFSLIYANVNEEDILLRTELDYLVAMFPYRFKVFYVLNNAPAGWKGGSGFVSKEYIQEHLPAASPSNKVLVCGPPPMVSAMKSNLEGLAFPPARTVSKPEDQVYVF